MTEPAFSLGPARGLAVYAIALATFLALDAVWLGVVAKGLYKAQLGHLLAPGVDWGAAVLFYLVFMGGLVFFVVGPALEAGSAWRAALHGALFGFVAYATYDLTNQATLRDWPALVTVVDLAWGTAVTAVTAFLTWQVSTRLLH